MEQPDADTADSTDDYLLGIENCEPAADRDIRTVPPDLEPHEFPDAAAVQIAEYDIWIANRDAIDPNNLDTMGLNPEHVVSVNKKPSPATTDHHPLNDGFVNAHDDFCAAVEAARERITQDGTIIVNCAAGISRSTAVIATALAAEHDFPLSEAINMIRRYRKNAHPPPKLQINAYGYLGSHENHPDAIEHIETLTDSVRLRGSGSSYVDEIRSTVSDS
jgi:atypical dual specificity phosphatase